MVSSSPYLLHLFYHLITTVALLNSQHPVITTAAYGKPLQCRALFANNTVQTIFEDAKLNAAASGSAKSQAAALDPMPSSELTELEESSSSSPDPSPSPEKRQPAGRRIQPTRNAESSKSTAPPTKRTIHTVSPGSAGSDDESPPKRANTKATNKKLPTSDSSMEVSEIQPALQEKQKQEIGKARPGRKKAGTTGKPKAPAKSRKGKLQEYMEESDEDENGEEKGKKKEDKPKVVPGACYIHCSFPLTY